MNAQTAALLYCLATAMVAGFQLALAAGAPWGAIAMAGRYPGRLPAPLRCAAAVQASLLIGFAWVVVQRAAGTEAPTWAAPTAWIVVAFSTVALVLNLITPVSLERRIWAPVALVMVASSLWVALS